MIRLVDTHCHLDFGQFADDRDQVMARAREAGVAWFVNVASSLKGSEDSVSLAVSCADVFATVGIHPHDADSYDPGMNERIEALSSQEKVVAVGEIGLDYYKNYSSAGNQRRMFVDLLKLSLRRHLPVVVHSRQADEDTLAMLKEYAPAKAVVHCFSGSRGFFEACMAAGYFVSFTCNITYKKAGGLRDLVREIPLERLLLETDAPFLSPEGLRGKRNEPSAVRRLAGEIARIREVSLETVAEVTTENAHRFFALPKDQLKGGDSR